MLAYVLAGHCIQRTCYVLFCQGIFPTVQYSKHRCLSAPVRGHMFTGVLVIQKHGQIFTGELKVRNEDNIIIGGELFLCEIISQISLRGSPVCSRGFTSKAFCTGEIHGLSGDSFCSDFFTGQITGVEPSGVLRRECFE